LEIRRADDIAPSFEGLKSRADALYVCSDPLVIANRIRINSLALAARLPTIYYSREYVEAGGLISYGPTGNDTDPASIRAVCAFIRMILSPSGITWSR
jgi:putative ABC transport system substrate-binding protein